ncbi:hypothetical protein LJC16_02260 [Bacteroidales bacterium OttesenSCG-928-C19]|nr:hypothetical protein [Bacteroidales bacterium OttesenSCG-928-C19]
MEMIIVKHGEKGELMRLFDVSYNTVKSALQGKTYSRKAFDIRKKAVERGGIVVEVKE